MSGVASESRLAYWANKLAVESEPGLSTTQLMVFFRLQSLPKFLGGAER